MYKFNFTILLCLATFDPFSNSPNQIHMALKDISKTATITPFGLYEYVRMLFGLKSAAQTFQRLMDTVFQNVSCILVYLYDILIAGL